MCIEATRLQSVGDNYFFDIADIFQHNFDQPG